MAKPLVIVESPAKAKTLGRFLGNKYRVEASYGHIRDLPESAADSPQGHQGQGVGPLGVDVESDFSPITSCRSRRRSRWPTSRARVKEASEAAAGHRPGSRRRVDQLAPGTRCCKPKIPVRRIGFHEITEDAVKEALAHPSVVDENLVRAQESRRILDRLYGYTLSPVLWKKVQTGLSAGRVQSVAVRLIVEREESGARSAAGSTGISRRRSRARAASSWPRSAARRSARGIGEGLRRRRPVQLKNQKCACSTKRSPRRWSRRSPQNLPWTVTSVEQKAGVERPAPPFTTSTLTQEASRKLGFATERTMQVAQRLFQGIEQVGNGERGLITYHRTDSTTLSEKALSESARVIQEMFGGEYYDGPRRYQTRVKNAQEAHEAIRPSEFRVTPSQLERCARCRRSEGLRADVEADDGVADGGCAGAANHDRDLGPGHERGKGASSRASGKAIEFAGFRRAYVEGSDDPAAELEEQENDPPAV